MNTNPFAAGIKTSELWISLLAMILTYLSAQGIVKATDINPIIAGVGQIYGGAVGILGLYAIAHSYIKSRTTIKTTMINGTTKTTT